MGDDSRKSLVYSLKNEWSLLWESIAGDEPKESESSLETPAPPLRVLSLDDIRIITRELSQDRRKLHRRLESLNKELELNSAKLESLRAVGNEDGETLKRMNELNEQGQKISQELATLDDKLKRAREHEEKIREATA